MPRSLRGGRVSAGDQEEVLAEVTDVMAPRLFLDDAEELEELVVGRVGGRSRMVDEDLDPLDAGAPQHDRAVRARRDEVPRALAEDRQRPVTVVGHPQVLGGETVR